MKIEQVMNLFPEWKGQVVMGTLEEDVHAGEIIEVNGETARIFSMSDGLHDLVDSAQAGMFMCLCVRPAFSSEVIGATASKSQCILPRSGAECKDTTEKKTSKPSGFLRRLWKLWG